MLFYVFRADAHKLPLSVSQFFCFSVDPKVNKKLTDRFCLNLYTVLCYNYALAQILSKIKTHNFVDETVRITRLN